MSVTALVLAALEGAGIAAGKGGASAAGSGAAKFAWTKIFGSEARAAEEVMAMAIIRAIEESTPAEVTSAARRGGRALVND